MDGQQGADSALSCFSSFQYFPLPALKSRAARKDSPAAAEPVEGAEPLAPPDEPALGSRCSPITALTSLHRRNRLNARTTTFKPLPSIASLIAGAL
jgi:hypothetical protein